MPTNHSVNIRGNEAIEKIAKETGGRIEIRMFPDNQLGGDNDMTAQVRNGGIDLYTAAATSIGPLVPFVGITNMAFAFADSTQAWKALDGDLGKLVIGAFAKVNLHAFDKMWANGFREITTATVPIKSAADLKGFKIRVPTSPVLLSLFRGLGAAPTSMNVSELYTALQTKLVDGQENPLSVIATRNFNEVQKYCALTNHVWDSFVQVANMETWKSLPANLQEIVARNLNESALKQREDADKMNASLQKDLEAKGMTFNTPDLASFRDALKKSGFYAQWQKTYGEDSWKVLEQYSGSLA
jgi:tripartite ATP-independent transporter DctP family solute receptor